MVKLKVDGEILTFKDWADVHSEFATYTRGRCEWSAEAHCGACEVYTEFCDCHRDCVTETLNSNHKWEEIKE